MSMFRLLRADEIDARIGMLKPTWASLLLYKDARCDMAILDETVGAFNWKREHSRDNANCTVSLWDKEKGQWISKEDTGTESNTEAEKGLASDSFKRACFNWGIGRELYTAPFIKINGKAEDLKYAKFHVDAIGYDENRNINYLVISSEGKVVYSFGKNAPKAVNAEPKPEQQEASQSVPQKVQKPEPKYDVSGAVNAFCNSHKITKEAFNSLRVSCIDAGLLKRIPSTYMDENQCAEMFHVIETYMGKDK